MEQNKTLHKYGLVGKNISYSFSRKYFETKFLNENITDCSYENFDLLEIEEIEKLLKTPNLKGLNVTIPYKEKVAPYLDKLSDTAREIKAINTICINKKGQTEGHNTDVYGFENSLMENWNLKDNGTKALILGTGGAAKAIKYVLKKNNIFYKNVSRNKTQENISYEDLTEEILSEYKLIINTTPLGTYPNINEMPNLNFKPIGKDHYFLI